MLMLFAVGCSKEQTADVVRSREVVIYASDAAKSSRTSFSYDEALDRCVTGWSAGDAMRVLLAAEGVELKDYLFNLVDASQGSFRCDEVEDGAALYDACAVYPSTATINAADYTAVVQVGAKEQTQTGGQPSHVAAYDPLWGTQSQVALDDIRLQMHHAAAVMQFSVKNSTGADVVVSSASVYAPTAIAGLHTLSLQTGELALVDDDNASESIELTIEDGALPDGKTLTAWVAMAPFAVAEGDRLVFIVETSDGGMYSYEKSFAGAVSFPAGKVMEMSAPIELTASKQITIDLTSVDSYPENFPKSNTQYEGVREYLFADEYPVSIYCTKPYSCGSKGDKLRLQFNGGNASSPVAPTTADYALIYLPYYEGYKLNEVGLTLDSTTAKGKYKIAIANPDNLEAVHSSSNNPVETYTFSAKEMEVDMGTDVTKQCCIYIHFNGVTINKNNCNCYITGLTINYVKQ